MTGTPKKKITIFKLGALLSRGMYQKEIARHFGCSQQVVSYHVGKLRRMHGLK
jgi:DNA-binding CsgD family transcriptional regulator